jgi:hypothetical protein
MVIDRKKRGFERLTAEERIEMARRAGRRSQALGRAHVWTREEARAAGLKAAENRRQRKGTP